MAKQEPSKPKSPSLSINPREMMERAIEAMRQSISEARKDGKASPSVGVVLCLPDGKVETSHRGELRAGDHAEFTLLERKHRASKLDGAILFATLEPCAPGARNAPKLSCAERIVLARIKKVWVGLEDPDPTVDRKGIKYLQENGVEVEMFDRELQEAIRAENKEFVAQALERKAASEAGKSKLIALSELERPIAAVALEDLSLEALDRYRTAAKISDAVDSRAFQVRLLRQGLLKEEGGSLRPTGFGFLLFGKEPRISLPQAGLLGTIHLEGGEETRDFDGPLVLIPELVEKWLQDKLPNPISRTQMRRRQGVGAIPFELLRESVVNALVHRDYMIVGAKCQLVVTEDTIRVRSPGGPVAPITLEQLQSFNAPELSRNPVLHYVFARMGLAEERGLGMKSLGSLPKELGLPLPKYAFENPYLSLTLYRTSESATRVLPPDVLKALNKDERAGWEFLASRTTTTKAEYAKELGFDERKAQRHLSHFVEMGLALRTGRGRSIGYQARK